MIEVINQMIKFTEAMGDWVFSLMVPDRPLVDPKIPLVPPLVVPASQRFCGPPMAAPIDLVAQQFERAFSQNYNL
jgi:hypothetical protein